MKTRKDLAKFFVFFSVEKRKLFIELLKRKLETNSHLINVECFSEIQTKVKSVYLL